MIIESRRAKRWIEASDTLLTLLMGLGLHPLIGWLVWLWDDTGKVVPPWELMPPWGYPATMIIGFIGGGLLLSIWRNRVNVRSPLRTGIWFAVLGVSWAYLLTGIIVEAPGYSKLFLFIGLGLVAILAMAQVVPTRPSKRPLKPD